MGSQSVDELLMFIFVAFLVFAALTPVLYSTFLAVRLKAVMPQRILFVVAATCMSYGLLALFVLLVSWPLQLYALFVAPELQQAGHFYGSWLVSGGHFFALWSWLALPVALVVASVWASRYLFHRWPRVAHTLGG